MSDTIVAIATPPGRGGVGIIRVSGPACQQICLALTKKSLQPRAATFTKFLKESGEIIDSGLSLFFAAPKSFTGEDVLELQAHGGPVVLDLLLRRVVELGARLARAGEFSERAFLNNKIDLVQAEAVAALINANTEQAAAAAVRSLQGEFSSRINFLVEELIKLRLYVEAAIDFPEEEIDFLADAHIITKINYLLQQLDEIQTQAQRGVLLQEGITVVIAGEPNAGKSTLINALTQEETAIVTPIAGTTRDTIKASINLDGVLLNVIDTAGIRDTTDIVEQQGIKRAKQALQSADFVLLVVDATKHAITELANIYSTLQQDYKSGARIIVVYNKIDCTNITSHVARLADHTVVALSANTGLGLELLRSEIKSLAGLNYDAEAGNFLARRRHLDAIQRAERCVLFGKECLEKNKAGELLAEELRQAQMVLSEITGVFTADDLLGRIFAEFCIGK